LPIVGISNVIAADRVAGSFYEQLINCPNPEPPMPVKIIISYDDTAADRDALALGRALGAGGDHLALAYVRHDGTSLRGQEELRDEEATELLARGARQLGDTTVATHVVHDASTGKGLRALVEREGADVIVFGSDYRTAAGRIGLGTSARTLLDGGPAAVAIAPADLRSGAAGIERISLLGGAGDTAAVATATSLAAAIGAEVVDADSTSADLLVVASRPETPDGRVRLSAASEYAVEMAGRPVLVVPRGVHLTFGADNVVASRA
jgi:nucleotide-binding universal stress UspA family protein